MRTYNIKFSDNNTNANYIYKTTKEGFRKMRSFAMMTRNRMSECYTYQFVDTLDDIRDLEEGNKMYVICSAYEVYTANTIEKFNEVVARMEKESRNDLGEKYMPNEFSAFMVKRTAQTWRYTSLCPELRLD